MNNSLKKLTITLFLLTITFSAIAQEAPEQTQDQGVEVNGETVAPTTESIEGN